MTRLGEITQYTDTFLRIAECGDWPNAFNGIQVENSGKVTKIGAAGDQADAGGDLRPARDELHWPA